MTAEILAGAIVSQESDWLEQARLDTRQQGKRESSDTGGEAGQGRTNRHIVPCLLLCYKIVQLDYAGPQTKL